MNVLIVDDHPLWVEILRSVVFREFDEVQPDTAGSLAEALRKAAARSPGLVLMDLRLPDSRGVDTVDEFRAAHPKCRLVVISADEDACTIDACMEAGAAGYVPKTAKPLDIAAALQRVVAGGTCRPPQAGRAQGPELTQRQVEVVRLIVKGLANKDIAKALNIAEGTVKQHARAAYATLGVSSRMQAVQALLRLGIHLGDFPPYH